MKNVEVKFAKNHPDTIIPSKRYEDGGFDIYARFDEEYMIIAPQETVMIPTDLCSAFPAGYVIILQERGSTGTKGMAQRCGVIDSGFRNPWFVPITNTTGRMIVITKSPEDFSEVKFYDNAIVYPYSKAICQAIVHEIPDVNVVEVSLEELNAIESERGAGQLGSSGK